MNGGKQPGAGRPPSINPARLLITIKATAAQKAKFLELGGSKWVKALLDTALTAKPKALPCANGTPTTQKTTRKP